MTSYLVYLAWAGLALALYHFGFRRARPTVVTWVLAGVVALLGFAALAYLSRPPAYDVSNDFRVYFHAGEDVSAHPEKLVEGDYGFVNVPILAWVFWPFAQLGQSLATKVFAVLGLLCVGAAYLITCRMARMNAGGRYLALVALAGSGPLVHSIWYGNLSHLVLLPLVLGALCLTQKRQVAAGVLFAICGVIKLPLLLLAPFIFLRGYWRAVASYAVTGIVILGASVAMFGLDLNLAWLGHVGKFLGKVVPAYNVQSVTALLVRLSHDFGPNLRNWNLYDAGPTFKLVNTAALLALVAATVGCLWRAGRPKGEVAAYFEVAAVVCLALALSSLSWSHYYSLLWLPVALLAARAAQGEMTKLDTSLLLLGALLLGMPVVTNPPPEALGFLNQIYRRAFISHTVIGGLILLGLLLRARLQQGAAERGGLSSQPA